MFPQGKVGKGQVVIFYDREMIEALADEVARVLAVRGEGVEGVVQFCAVDGGQDWVSKRVAAAHFGRSVRWVDRFAAQHPEVRVENREGHQRVGHPMFSIKRIKAALEGAAVDGKGVAV